MTEKIQLSGLCTNCLAADDCRYRVNHTKPIIFCEEFSCTDPSELNNTISGVIPKVENLVNSSLKGICINCENIDLCNLQKTDTAIMNCEEYR